MEGVGNRRGEYYHVLVYTENGEDFRIFEEKIPVWIVEEPRGKIRAWHWSPLALITEFYINSKPCGKTLAEMSREEYLRSYSTHIDRVGKSVYEQLG